MIGKTGVHAIRALVQLSRLPDGQSLASAQVAARIDAPPNYLGKLLRQMARRGLVESRKGAGGGFRLSRDPRSIRLLDVVEPIASVEGLSRCVLGQLECSDAAPCHVHPRWTSIRDDYLKMLAETTIADLVEGR